MQFRVVVCAVMCAAAGCRGRAPVAVEAAAPAAPGQHRAGNIREIRATGTLQAVRAYTVQVPRIEGQNQGPNGRLTLVRLAPNGTAVKEGEMVAEFDRTPQEDAAREALAKYEDLGHQVRQKAAENRSESEKRALKLKEAEADLGKAELQLRKGPILSDINRLKNEERAAAARTRVEMLKQIDTARTRAEAAALRILELQTGRQKVALDRAKRNAEKLVLRASIAGMVALENVWRGGSMGNAQEGDQLWPGQALLKIFDPSGMRVRALISEPDRALLAEGALALVRLDAYPDAVYRARFESASPVATAAMGSPIKSFASQFRLEQSDPRLLPDLSVAVMINAEEK
ncbi:MAG: HlyD family secretion protein [Bryobacteraceae bacterium]